MGGVMKQLGLALLLVLLLVGCSSNEELVGLWVYSVAGGLGEARLELNNDGTGHVRITSLTEEVESDVTWKVEDEELCITTFSGDALWRCAAYAIEGDRMTYTLFSGEPLLFERWPDN